jgi:hypothetical protein
LALQRATRPPVDSGNDVCTSSLEQQVINKRRRVLLYTAVISPTLKRGRRRLIAREAAEQYHRDLSAGDPVGEPPDGTATPLSAHQKNPAENRRLDKPASDGTRSQDVSPLKGSAVQPNPSLVIADAGGP